MFLVCLFVFAFFFFLIFPSSLQNISLLKSFISGMNFNKLHCFYWICSGVLHLWMCPNLVCTFKICSPLQVPKISLLESKKLHSGQSENVKIVLYSLFCLTQFCGTCWYLPLYSVNIEKFPPKQCAQSPFFCTMSALSKALLERVTK